MLIMLTSYPLNAYCDALIPVVLEAGDAIMRHYQTDVDVKRKDDGSPTTLADSEAEAIILKALAALTPDIPVVAEESMAETIAPLIKNSTFWLVDPLDGTKEFLKKTDEFTVNIGLIVAGIPVLGIIFAPALGDLYYGFGDTVTHVNKAGETHTHSANTAHPKPDALRVVASKSHSDKEKLLKMLNGTEIESFISAGSSLKFCLVAIGAADLYPRTGPTMEWDTAAGDAIVRAAGGRVCTYDGKPLTYNKPTFLNPAFVVTAGGVGERFSVFGVRF
jgi:3'(2'), 5'-bisphosphate nucleotidase